MRSTVITHIKNESYLLPMWLRHHVNLFDDGIIIDYNSSDDPHSIVNEIAPHWNIMQSNIPHFGARELDNLVSSVEKNLVGNRLTLTITEFLLGEPRAATEQVFIPVIKLINTDDNLQFTPEASFHSQVKTGIGDDTSGNRLPGFRCRSMHQAPIAYNVGRHFQEAPSGEKFLIYKVNNCYVSQKMIDRRLQIQNEIPPGDIQNGLGF